MLTQERQVAKEPVTIESIDQLLTDMMPALSQSATEAEALYNLPDGLPEEQRVPLGEKAARGHSCQQMATLVREMLQREGCTEVQLLRKDLRNLGDCFLEHVVVGFEHEGESWYVDPTYSQIFKHFGLSFHQLRQGYSPYPDELHVMYRAEDVLELAEWAATVMTQYWQKYGNNLEFQQAHGYTTAVDGWDPTSPVLMRPQPVAVMAALFTDIWEPSGYEPYEGIRSINPERTVQLYMNALRLK